MAYKSELIMEGSSEVKSVVKKSVVVKDDIVTVKTVETITTTRAEKEPEVKVREKIEVYNKRNGLETLPEEVLKAIEDTQRKDIDLTKIRMKAASSNFENKLLQETNNARKIHNVDELKLSEELSKFARERVREMADRDELINPSGKLYGENVACLWSNDPEHQVKAVDIAKRWQSESGDYQFDKEPADLKQGHFTQMVWKGSKEFGAAAAKSKSNKIYVAAIYKPPGNYVNEFRNNVFPPNQHIEVFLEAAAKEKLRHKSDSSSDSDSSDDEDFDEKRLKKFNDRALKISNDYRKKHGVPPLKYNENIANFAQDWAKQLAGDGTFRHRTSLKYGENLYMSGGLQPPKAKQVCRKWYSEEDDYDYNKESNALTTNHFTQVVWKETKEMGIGIAKGRTGWVIVANYSPSGNIVGHYKENVLKPVA